jgi:hypothetical protein
LNKQINQPTIVSVRIAAKDVVVDHTVAEIAVSRQRLATYGFGADLCCEEVAQIFERLLVVTPLEKRTSEGKRVQRQVDIVGVPEPDS